MVELLTPLAGMGSDLAPEYGSRVTRLLGQAHQVQGDAQDAESRLFPL